MIYECLFVCERSLMLVCYVVVFCVFECNVLLYVGCIAFADDFCDGSWGPSVGIEWYLRGVVVLIYKC